MSVRDERLAAAAAAITGIQVGATIVATRFVIDQTSPASLAMLRYAIGVLWLIPVVLLTSRARFARRDVVPIAALGIAQFGILIVLLNFSLQVVAAGRVALLFATFPLQTMLLAAALGRERLTAVKAAGVALTIAGVGLAVGEDALAGGIGRREWLGVLAVLAAAFCGALCTVLYRPYLTRYPVPLVGTFAMLSSFCVLALAAGLEGSLGTIPAITGGGWLAILFIGSSSGIGYLLWLWALGHTTPTRVAVFLALSPLTAALLGAALLGEALSWGLVLGLACVAAGLHLAHRRAGGLGAVP